MARPILADWRCWQLESWIDAVRRGESDCDSRDMETMADRGLHEQMIEDPSTQPYIDLPTVPNARLTSSRLVQMARSGKAWILRGPVQNARTEIPLHRMSCCIESQDPMILL